jgi:hypothetical protein
MKDTFTEILQTKEMCINMAFETDLEPLNIGDFKYKIKCGGFNTAEWKGFNTKSAADTLSLFGVSLIILNILLLI